MKIVIAGVIAAVAAMVGGCAHQQVEQPPEQPIERWVAAPPGDTAAKYEALPEYLVTAPPVVPPGNVGRGDARVPVAGGTWQPEPARLDALRLRLAQLDELVVSLRTRGVSLEAPPAVPAPSPSAVPTPAPSAVPAPAPSAVPTPAPSSVPTPTPTVPQEEQRVGGAQPTSPETVPARITAVAREIRKLVADRPDLEAEADEMMELAHVMEAGVPVQRREALRRITELVDLLRIQIATG